MVAKDSWKMALLLADMGGGGRNCVRLPNRLGRLPPEVNPTSQPNATAIVWGNRTISQFPYTECSRRGAGCGADFCDQGSVFPLGALEFIGQLETQPITGLDAEVATQAKIVFRRTPPPGMFHLAEMGRRDAGGGGNLDLRFMPFIESFAQGLKAPAFAADVVCVRSFVRIMTQGWR